MQPYDAILVVSYGGPERPEDVMPFLENVTRGKNVPAVRLEAVAEHYYQFGGVSPLGESIRYLLAALSVEMTRANIDLPIYWANLYWHPMLDEVLEIMAEEGIRRPIAFCTSAYCSEASCRRYVETIAAAGEPLGDAAPQVEKLRPFFNHPGMIEAQVDYVIEAIEQLDTIPVDSDEVPDIDGMTPSDETVDSETVRDRARPSADEPPDDVGPPFLLFTAHSLPVEMARKTGYDKQVEEAAHLISTRLYEKTDIMFEWSVGYQSRSGPPTVPWLEPDLENQLTEIAEMNGRVVIVPVGFVCEHMETAWDLDVEAEAMCGPLELEMSRASTVAGHPRFTQMIRELIEEKIADGERLQLGDFRKIPETCPLCGKDER